MTGLIKASTAVSPTVHLLAANVEITSGFRGYVAVCGEVLADLPTADDLDVPYCRACVRAAARHTAGEVGDLPPARFERRAPAGHRLSIAPGSAPGGQPDPQIRLPGTGGGAVLVSRWVRCPRDQHLHLVPPDQLAVITSSGYGRSECGRWVHVGTLSFQGWSKGFCDQCLVMAGSDR